MQIPAITSAVAGISGLSGSGLGGVGSVTGSGSGSGSGRLRLDALTRRHLAASTSRRTRPPSDSVALATGQASDVTSVVTRRREGQPRDATGGSDPQQGCRCVRGNHADADLARAAAPPAPPPTPRPHPPPHMPKLASVKDTWRSIEPRGQLTMVVSFLLHRGHRVLPLQLRHAAQLHDAPDRPLPDADQPRHPGPGGRRRRLQGRQRRHRGERRRAASSRPPRSRSARPASARARSPAWPTSPRPASARPTPSSRRCTSSASQGDIERQIESITGVSSAQVQIVMPTDTLFADQSSQATASVLLTTDTTFDPAAVSGIAHMVASGVQGLSAQNVTITDQTGAMLWPAAARASTGRRARPQARRPAELRLADRRARSTRCSPARSVPARARPR